MRETANLLLLLIVVLDVYLLAQSRLTACVRTSAFQGACIGALPAVLWWNGLPDHGIHWIFLTVLLVGIKAVMIPSLLMRALRVAGVRHEVEPFVSLHVSVLVGTGLVGLSFWLAGVLVLPHPMRSTLVVPAALSTLLVGFLILVSRRQAITQMIGYLVLENGVFIFGQTLAGRIPFAAEMAMLLDLLVGVFIMGIAIHHISREFDHIDTERLASLKD